MCIRTSHGSFGKAKQVFPLKLGSVGPPKIYLGANISKVALPNGVKYWAISDSQYVQEALRNVETHLKGNVM